MKNIPKATNPNERWRGGREKPKKPSLLPLHRLATARRDGVICWRSPPHDFTVLNGVLKLTNEVTLGEFWCVSAIVSSWHCRASQESRQLLNRCMG